MAARDIFDKAILLNPGETLLIPCISVKQQESTRVSLSYQRRVFLENSAANFDLNISKVTKNNRPCVTITKVPRITEGFIISQDGSVKTVSLMGDPEPTIEKEAIDVARMVAKMREDGMSEAEIAAYFNGTPEVSNFDGSECVPDLSLKEEG